MNRQEVFDKAYLSIVAQGRRSADLGSCLYRGPSGAKCAVGHLLSDEQIKKYNVVNSESVWDLDRDLISEILPDDDEAPHFLSSLQVVHDTARTPETFVQDFKRKAAGFADRYNLQVPATV